MKQDYPVLPPELVRSWWEAWCDASPPASSHHWIASQAAAWGWQQCAMTELCEASRALAGLDSIDNPPSERD